MNITQPYVKKNTHDYKNLLVKNLGIFEFYEFKEKESAKEINAVPDGCVDLMYAIGEQEVKCYLGGTVLNLKYWPFQENYTYFGIRFIPGHELLPKGVYIQDIINRDIELPVNCYGVEVEEPLLKAKDMYSRAKFMSSLFLNQACREQKFDFKREIEQYISKRIYETRGTISVKTLSEETGYSECYVRKTFHEIHGISPKVFEKIVRFQNALSEMALHKDRAIFELAQESGYYDQSHMVKEFKQYMGLTPELYKKFLEQY